VRRAREDARRPTSSWARATRRARRPPRPRRLRRRTQLAQRVTRARRRLSDRDRCPLDGSSASLPKDARTLSTTIHARPPGSTRDDSSSCASWARTATT
jgi:hypothetical protein